MGLSFLPWTLTVVLRQAQGADWRRAGLLAGLLWACVPWCGGYIVLLYGFLAFGLVALVGALWPSAPARRGPALLRAGGMLALLCLVFATVAAGRLLPTSAWSALTDRAEALSYETTLAGGDGRRPAGDGVSSTRDWRPSCWRPSGWRRRWPPAAAPPGPASPWRP